MEIGHVGRQSAEDGDGSGDAGDELNAVKKKGGKIAFEWPTECELWKDKQVIEMLGALTLLEVRFHGCTLGLVGRDGGPIKKPWTICTDCAQIRDAFLEMRCPGESDDHVHDK